MKPSDINPDIYEGGPAKIDAATLARLRGSRAIEPKGPRLNLVPPPGQLHVEPPVDLDAEEIGGLHVGRRVRPDDLVIVTVISVNPFTAGMATGDRVLAVHKDIKSIAYDGHVYYYVSEGSIVAKVMP